MTLKSTPLNHVIQDLGFEQKFGRAPHIGKDSETDRIVAHLEHVCKTLESSHLATISGRAQMIQLLKQYITEAQFPSQFDYKSSNGETRVPCFIDDKGVHCAAGYLMKHSGFAQLAQDLNSNFRFNYVHEMLATQQDASNANIFSELNRFLQESNLTALEVATIQPTYDCTYLLYFCK